MDVLLLCIPLSVFKQLKLPGDVHRLANCTKLATSALDADISGLISLALAMGAPGSVSTLRQIIAKLLAEECEIIHDLPPRNAEVQAYRENIFNLFLPIQSVHPSRRKQNKLRRFIIAYFLNGSLHQETLQHYCSYACCNSFEHTVQRMSKYLTWALIPTKPPIFTRNRWTRYDIAIDAVGILASVHNLLPRVVLRFLGNSVPPPPPPLASDGDDNEKIWGEILDDNGGNGNGPLPVPLTGGKPDEDGGDQKEQHQDHDQGDQEESAAKLQGTFDWATFNKQQRTQARDWIQTKPWVRLCVLKDRVSGVVSSLLYRCLIRI